MTENQSPAVGVQQFTPDQVFFRQTNARGRWASDPTTNNVHTGYHMKFNADGTCDMIRLEAGAEGWTDLGGQGAYDIAAGRC